MPKERSREKKEARALAAELGVNYTTALRILRERRAEQSPQQPAPDAAGSDQ